MMTTKYYIYTDTFMLYVSHNLYDDVSRIINLNKFPIWHFWTDKYNSEGVSTTTSLLLIRTQSINLQFELQSRTQFFEFFDFLIR